MRLVARWPNRRAKCGAARHDRTGSVTTPRVTLLDVAQRAGVSRTTASFVMTGRRDMRISSDAEQRVLQAARELNYRPSLLARSLRTNLSQTIGLISDVIATEVFAGEVIRGSMATALLHDHLMFIGETEGDPEVEKRLVQSMLDRGVGGFVYASMYTRNVRVSKTLRDQPLVLLNSLARGKPLPSVIPDEREAGRSAVRELLRHGHRDQIVVVGERAPQVIAAAERLAGVEEVLRQQGTELAGSIDTMWWPEYAHQAVRAYLEAGHRPTAFVCLNDRIAMGTYQAAHDLGLVCAAGHLGGLVRRFRPGGLAAAATDQRGDSTLRDGPTSRRTAAHAGPADRRPTGADAAARPGIRRSAAGSPPAPAQLNPAKHDARPVSAGEPGIVALVSRPKPGRRPTRSGSRRRRPVGRGAFPGGRRPLAQQRPPAVLVVHRRGGGADEVGQDRDEAIGEFLVREMPAAGNDLDADARDRPASDLDLARPGGRCPSLPTSRRSACSGRDRRGPSSSPPDRANPPPPAARAGTRPARRRRACRPAPTSAPSTSADPGRCAACARSPTNRTAASTGGDAATASTGPEPGRVSPRSSGFTPRPSPPGATSISRSVYCGNWYANCIAIPPPKL